MGPALVDVRFRRGRADGWDVRLHDGREESVPTAAADDRSRTAAPCDFSRTALREAV